MDFEIVQWKDCYSGDYIKLSLEWLNKYVKVEQPDIDTIEHPYEAVLNNGGMIWFAICDNQAIGTISMINLNNNTYELAKLAVTEKHKGYGIGKALVKTAVDFARYNDAKEIELYTNSCLEPAIKTYTSFGFKKIDMDKSKFETADVMMKLIL